MSVAINAYQAAHSPSWFCVVCFPLDRWTKVLGLMFSGYDPDGPMRPTVLVVVMSPLSFNATELWSQSISYQTSKLPVDGQKFSVFYTRYTISVI